jgi:hypothetical protein
MSGAKPFREDLGWRWQAFGGRWLLVTDGGGEQVILSAAHHSSIHTRDLETGVLRAISPSDRVAKMLAATPDVRRSATSLLYGIDIGLVSIKSDADDTLALILGNLRTALAKSGGA